MRLTKALALTGACSRRQAERLVTSGRVTVNGHPVGHPAAQVVVGRDSLALDGRKLFAAARDYVLAHKPSDGDWPGPDALPPAIPADANQQPRSSRPANRMFGLGRMAPSTSGLLFLTNDGELVNQLSRADGALEEEYLALVSGRPSAADLRRLRRGTSMGQERACLAAVERLDADHAGSAWWLTMTVADRTSRRRLRALLASVGHRVLELRRTRLGPLELGELGVGNWRRLTEAERTALADIARGAPAT